MKVVYKATTQLIPYANNAKIHSDIQISKIAASIKEFGFNNPILLDGDNGIIAGHGRLIAAQKLGLEQVPCIELSHLSNTQKKAYILADNRLGEVGVEWDMELVNLELEALQDVDFGLEITGFELLNHDDNYNPEPPNEFKAVDERILKYRCPRCDFEFD